MSNDFLDFHQPEDRRTSRARERQQARRAQREMVTQRVASPSVPTDANDAAVPTPRQPREEAKRYRRPQAPKSFQNAQERITWLAKDFAWYAVNRPHVARFAAASVAGIVLLFVLVHLLTGRVFPNVWSMGTPLGSMTIEEAEAALARLWDRDLRLQLKDGERSWEVRPADIGLTLDARATAERARSVGLSGLPFGYGIEPIVTIDLFRAQEYLLALSEESNYPPVNATYQWVGTELVGVEGTAGRVLDIGMTMETLKQEPVEIALARTVDLAMLPLEPDVLDPTPYLDQVRALTTDGFTLTGYDPFRDELIAWSTDRPTLTSWLHVEDDGIGIRQDVFSAFLSAQNASLNPNGEDTRYLEATESVNLLERAFRAGEHEAAIRIRYRPVRFEVDYGDTGYLIARKTGIPFLLIDNANPGLEWESLSAGDMVNVPTRDVTLPIEPVMNKRIIVDMETQSMIAYENGEIKFEWLISTGLPAYPTYPGVFQILTHDETALGSTFELCGSSGCGQWEMYWFMGIYEVVPGLMNGFHGAVLLPNGTYLGGGNVGAPFTYGCVMSENSNAEELFYWADEGTIVEIISDDYEPQSELGRQALARMRGL